MLYSVESNDELADQGFHHGVHLGLSFTQQKVIDLIVAHAYSFSNLFTNPKFFITTKVPINPTIEAIKSYGS